MRLDSRELSGSTRSWACWPSSFVRDWYQRQRARAWNRSSITGNTSVRRPDYEYEERSVIPQDWRRLMVLSGYKAGTEQFRLQFHCLLVSKIRKGNKR